MKAVILALVVLLVVNHSESLRCFCGGEQKICSSRIETCVGSGYVCGTIRITTPSQATYSKGCVKPRDCAILNYSDLTSCVSCGFDLCNR